MTGSDNEPTYDRMDMLPTARPSSRRAVLCHDATLLLLGVVAVIALVFSAIALSRPGTSAVHLDGMHDNLDSSAATDNKDKIWVFAIGHDDKNNLEYIDDLTGTIRGFHVDIVEAVCGLANKNCRMMWDVYENCYESKAGERPRPGVGLVSRWYDGCTGWYATYERMVSVSFTTPFRKPIKSVFYVKQGNPRGFVSTDLTGKIIGFFDGDATNEFCLQREQITGSDLPAENIRHYSTRSAAIAAVNTNQVDALFSNTHIYNLASDLKVAAGDPITACTQGGGGIMVRKDSRLPDWWNPAFEQLKQSSEYRRICDQVTTNHENSDEGVDCVN